MPSPNELPERRALRELLATMAIELETLGRLKEGAAEVLIPILLEDTFCYPEEFVIDAVKAHRLEDKWWPVISDLLKHIRPRIEARDAHEGYLARERKTMSFMLDGADDESTKRITSAFARQGITYAQPETIENKSGFKIPELKRIT